MIDRPAFKPIFRVEVVDSEGVFLLSESGQSLLRGYPYVRLAPLIDGQRTVDDLIDAAKGHLTAAEVYYTLAVLEEQGYIIEAENVVPVGEAAFWAALGTDNRHAARGLHTSSVAVTSLCRDDMPSTVLCDALAALGMQARGANDAADISVVLVDDYLDRRLGPLNEQAIRSGRPWMLVKPVGRTIWVGPIIRPGQTGCWQCLAQRLAANRRVEQFVQAKMGVEGPLPVPQATLPTTGRLASPLAATEIAIAIVQGEQSRLSGVLLTFDLISLQTQRHVLIRRPQCLACGQPETERDSVATPIILERRPKIWCAEGSQRSATPEQTLRRYEQHVSPITGVVSVLQRLSDEDDQVMHTYQAGHNWAIKDVDVPSLLQHLRSFSGGKGTTDAQARASALCEALERYSGVFRGDESRTLATFASLGSAAIHPAACLLFSERQYKERATWNKRDQYFSRVPEPFDDTSRVDWTPVWSLTRRQVRYLPTALCYFGYPIPPERAFCWADSNGNAAGNTLEEAVLQGLLELVERDAVALWWYNRVQRPEIDLDRFDDSYVQGLRRAHQTLNRHVWALDLTSDLGIPVAVAITRRSDQTAEEIVFGFGAHLDPKLALVRALTEANQLLAALVARNRPKADRPSGWAPDLHHWLTNATVASQPFLAPDRRVQPTNFAGSASLASEDVGEDARRCQEVVERQGLEVLVLDQTRADVGMPVAKVVVPGLRHFWARLAPGRLYGVPVKLGWLEEPLPESALNPIPLFV